MTVCSGSQKDRAKENRYDSTASGKGGFGGFSAGFAQTASHLKLNPKSAPWGCTVTFRTQHCCPYWASVITKILVFRTEAKDPPKLQTLTLLMLQHRHAIMRLSDACKAGRASIDSSRDCSMIWVFVRYLVSVSR